MLENTALLRLLSLKPYKLKVLAVDSSFLSPCSEREKLPANRAAMPTKYLQQGFNAC